MELRTLAEELRLPEGSAFDPAGDLWCVEVRGGTLVRFTEQRGVERIRCGGAPNGLAFDAKGRALICDASRNEVPRFDPTTGKWELLAAEVNDRPLQNPNDLAFDAAGNLLFTCPGESRHEPIGYICSLGPGAPLFPEQLC